MSNDRSDRAPAPVQQPRGKVNDQTPAATSRAEIDAFLSHVKALDPAAETGTRGRLIFALDATMSRQPTWDTACRLQAEMFREATAAGGLDIQLVYYRSLAECKASPWIAGAETARRADVANRLPRRPYPDRKDPRPRTPRERQCQGGGPWSSSEMPWRNRSTTSAPVPASLGLRNVPAFMFQEGYDPVCEQAFREIARLTRGAYCRFAPGAAHELGELLRAAAAYAAGGMKALAD